MRNVKILSTGSSVPPKIYTNAYLETIAPTKASWIEENLGIQERHVAGQDQCTSDLAVQASLHALQGAGLKPENLDMIIVATATPDRQAPSTAAILQDKLEAYNAAAFDISAVCSGFLYAMSVASQFIALGTCNHVLIVGADTFSRIVDWKRRDCVFFGDGAGAAVMTHTRSGDGLLACRLFTDGRGRFDFTVPAGGSEIPASPDTINRGLHYFHMDATAVYDTGTRVLPEAVRKVLEDAGLGIGQIDMLIPHQPSIRILKKTAETLGLPFEKVMTNMSRFANTGAGTIPILLDEVRRAGKIKDGDHIVFAAVGAGWTYGAAVMKWI